MRDPLTDVSARKVEWKKKIQDAICDLRYDQIVSLACFKDFIIIVCLIYGSRTIQCRSNITFLPSKSFGVT